MSHFQKRLHTFTIRRIFALSNNEIIIFLNQNQIMFLIPFQLKDLIVEQYEVTDTHITLSLAKDRGNNEGCTVFDQDGWSVCNFKVDLGYFDSFVISNYGYEPNYEDDDLYHQVCSFVQGSGLFQGVETIGEKHPCPVEFAKTALKYWAENITQNPNTHPQNPYNPNFGKRFAL